MEKLVLLLLLNIRNCLAKSRTWLRNHTRTALINVLKSNNEWVYVSEAKHHISHVSTNLKYEENCYGCKYTNDRLNILLESTTILRAQVLFLR